jgi:hypothetical protein
MKKLNLKPKNNLVIVAIIIVCVLTGLALLTKVGAIPNYLGLDLLCSDAKGYDGDNSLPDPDRLYPTLKKPAIYLYPQKIQPVSVKLSLSGVVTMTYPDYGNGWNVVAQPDGTITNLSDNRVYSYLFWEGIDSEAKYDLSKGFVVKGSDVAAFLQSSLAKLGLSPKEYNEFIVFWLPHMMNNKYNLIHFATKAEYDDRAVLSITPKPDSLLRVFMVTKKLDNRIDITAQELAPFERNGFTVVEWGGSQI